MKQHCPASQNYYPEEKHTTPIVQFLPSEASARTFRVLFSFTAYTSE